MRVAIDISQVIYGTGVSQYTEALVHGLLKLDKENEYTLFGGTFRRRSDILSIFPRAKVFPYPPRLADLVWNRLHTFPVEKLVGPIDVLHTSDWAEPPSNAFKVTTVHDLIPLRFPKMIHRKILDVHMRRLRWVKKESDRVIVPSRATKEDLVDFGVAEKNIRVIPEANVISKSGKDAIKAAKVKFETSDDYLVAFASAPYKNIERIVKAFDLSSAGKNLKLVVIGRQSVPLLKSRRKVRLTGYVSDQELSALISGSRGLIFASLYEGFGQPVLEGFACGVPVVTSDISSLPEVAGDAAELVDPYSVDSIAEGIEKILRGPKAYIDKGLKRIKQFSWEKAAFDTIKVYNEAKK